MYQYGFSYYRGDSTCTPAVSGKTTTTDRLSPCEGAFGFVRYLCKVADREPTMVCLECGCTEDTAQHTLAECPKWAEPRQVLVAIEGKTFLCQPWSKL
ncbi:jg20360 [Pararge aegeria aegeria]|uniref:Jg20360 protein n=1 Tax=Pararge aegeria aegeria TaxID=348720 RepID=A0A8S4REQ0_9NEOP|nr:jg20360 [Pararge aegeria aegeria]